MYPAENTEQGVKQCSMQNAAVQEVGSEVLANAEGFSKHPKLRHVTSSLLLKYTWQDGAAHTADLRFHRVGASRVVFRACASEIPYVVKIAQCSYQDDNEKEFSAVNALPPSLLPPIFFFW